MYILIYPVISAAILFILIQLGPKSSDQFKKKRFSIGLVGMLFVQFLLFLVLHFIVARFWSDVNLGNIWIGIVVFSVLLALWATRRRREP